MKIIKHKKIYILAGFIWCLFFALASFYWVSGGMAGVRSLGGYIYQKALEREDSFIAMVWLTGFVKLGGGFLLLLLLKEWSNVANRLLTYGFLIVGLFFFLYGLSNFSTLVLSGIGLLHLQVSGFALKWRLLLWEPFWMLGGVLFALSAISFKQGLQRYQ